MMIVLRRIFIVTLVIIVTTQSKVKSAFVEYRHQVGLGLGVFNTLHLYDYKGELWTFYNGKVGGSGNWRLEIAIRRVVIEWSFYHFFGLFLLPYEAEVASNEEIVQQGAGFGYIDLWGGYRIFRESKFGSLNILPLSGVIITRRAGVLQVRNKDTGESFHLVNYKSGSKDFLCGVRIYRLRDEDKFSHYDFRAKYMIIPSKWFHIVGCEFVFPSFKSADYELGFGLGVEIHYHDSMKAYSFYISMITY